MVRLTRLAVAALSVVGVSTTTAASAFAEPAAGAPFTGCQVAIGANGMSVPSNAPALLVNDSSNQATATISAELVSAEGRAPFGAPTKDVHGLMVMALPKASIGSHKIATKVVCSNGSPESLQETSLAVTAPVELPTAVGTLTVRPSPTPTSVERIVLEASPGLRAFKDVAIVELSMNDAAGTGNQRGRFAEEFSVNTGSVCVENGTLHREKRTVRISVTAHLAGVAQSPAPATLDVQVDCGAIRWTSDSDFDGSKSPGTPSSAEPDGTNPGGGNNASGCSAAPTGLAAGTSSLFAAATAVALLASRRRRRPFPPG
jgi:MYXO-CTERM domain-containing protein